MQKTGEADAEDASFDYDFRRGIELHEESVSEAAGFREKQRGLKRLGQRNINLANFIAMSGLCSMDFDLMQSLF